MTEQNKNLDIKMQIQSDVLFNVLFPCLRTTHFAHLLMSLFDKKPLMLYCRPCLCRENIQFYCSLSVRKRSLTLCALAWICISINCILTTKSRAFHQWAKTNKKRTKSVHGVKCQWENFKTLITEGFFEHFKLNYFYLKKSWIKKG